jgi:carbonic anhydrase
VIRKIICLAVILLLAGFVFGCNPTEKPVEKPVQVVKPEIKWGYQGEGAPENWGKLKPEFAFCGTGMSQSPVDIAKTYKTKLEAIGFAYKETPLKIINDGHAVQVNYEPGSSVTIDGQQYELLQLHFHAPSEHTINGVSSDMEIHMIHKDDKGDIAVVGVFLKKGKPSKAIQALWDNLPTEVDKENVVDGVSVNASDLLPKDKKYYHYYGSLTTPPCSEGVNWIVLKASVEVSEEQIQKLQTLMGFDNNRPALPLNKRFVLESQ